MSEATSAISSSKRTVLFTIEIKERELIPKCLLALELAKRNYRVYLGSFRAISWASSKLGPSILFHKSSSLRISLAHKLKGGIFASLDEEGGPTIPRSRVREFCEQRYQKVSDHLNDIIFVPGLLYETALKENKKNLSVKICRSGWPRIDLWDENYKALYQPDVETLKKRYGPFFLCITSFGLTSEKTYRKRIKSSDTEFMRNIWAAKYKAFQDYSTLLKELAARIGSGEKIIVRPHPSESVTDWRKILKQFSNVIVVKEGDISAWILAAQSILQYNSTASIQAAMFGKKSVQYKISEQQGITDSLTFELSENAQTPDEVYAFLKQNSATYSQSVKNNAKNKLKKEVDLDDDVMASEKIVDALESIQTPVVAPIHATRFERLFFCFIHFKNRFNLLSKLLRKRQGDRRVRIEKMRGGINPAEIQEVLLALTKIQAHVDTPTVSTVVKNLIEIEIRNAH